MGPHRQARARFIVCGRRPHRSRAHVSRRGLARLQVIVSERWPATILTAYLLSTDLVLLSLDIAVDLPCPVCGGDQEATLLAIHDRTPICVACARTAGL